MDNSLVDSEIRANKIKEGVLDKRSKFLKEWRDRWVVLTQNYLFTFKSKVYVDPTDIVDIRTIKSIKSYVKHYEDRETCAFKLSADDNSLYFRCKGAPEKWSWIVAIERLMDYRNNGRSAYNDLDSIKTKGFDPVGGATTSPPSPTKPPVKEVAKEVVKEVVKDTKELEQAKRKEDEAKRLLEEEARKRAEEEARKKAAEELRKLQELKKAEQEALRVANEAKRAAQEQQKAQKVIEKKPVEQPVIRSKIEGQEGAVIEKEGKNFSQLKELYEKKIEQVQLSKANSRSDAPSSSSKTSGSTLESITHHRRAAVVEGLFGEFETKNIEGFQLVMEFIVDMAANPKTGFSNYVFYETKNHKMRKAFSELFVDVYTQETTEAQAQAMLSFLLVAYYQSEGLFDANQIRRLKKTVLRYISTFKKDETRILAMKAFIMLNGADKYDTESVRPHLKDLQEAENGKNQELKGLARKIREQASL